MADDLGEMFDGKGEEWLGLREDGWTFKAIAEKAGVAQTTVKNKVKLELARMAKPDADVMRLRLAKKYLHLEGFATNLMAEGGGDEKGSNRDIRGGELLLKILEAKRKMYGLDAPAQIEATVNPFGSLTREQVIEKAVLAGGLTFVKEEIVEVECVDHDEV